ncbi:MAG: TIR domain-containing protein [Saprospiraceae bacterium]|nr:TIR domain-containing protein [Saprospiraceae bacterium]
MAKRVFFSFHYQDVSDFRANVVRQHWVCKPDREVAGFFDASIWESAQKVGDTALKKLINENIHGTSNTCILIGSDTYSRRWVRYEIFRSFHSLNHLFAVHINSIRDKDRNFKTNGPNPLNYAGIHVSSDGITVQPKELNYYWENSIDYPKWNLETPMAPKFRNSFHVFSDIFPEYDWMNDDGYNNFSSWVK